VIFYLLISLLTIPGNPPNLNGKG